MISKRNIPSITTSSLTFCLLTLLILTGCGDGSSGEAAGSGNAPPIEKEISEARLNEIMGQSERPFVLVNFFATWCKPCKEEIPDLVALQQDPESKVEVILVSIDDPGDVDSKLGSFLGNLGVTFKAYSHSEGENWFVKQFYPDWGQSIPLTLIYEKGGDRIAAIEGLTDRSEIELLINKHLKLGSS